MFKNKIAVYAFMGAVCALFLAQPAFADTAKRIDVDERVILKSFLQAGQKTELAQRLILVLKTGRISMPVTMLILNLRALTMVG